MSNTNYGKEDEMKYAYWKILAWRFIRAGLAGGASTVATVQIILRPDWNNGKQWILAISSAFVAGFISAFFLAVRDYFGNKKKTTLIDKLPL